MKLKTYMSFLISEINRIFGEIKTLEILNKLDQMNLVKYLMKMMYFFDHIKTEYLYWKITNNPFTKRTIKGAAQYFIKHHGISVENQECIQIQLCVNNFLLVLAFIFFDKEESKLLIKTYKSQSMMADFESAINFKELGEEIDRFSQITRKMIVYFGFF